MELCLFATRLWRQMERIFLVSLIMFLEGNAYLPSTKQFQLIVPLLGLRLQLPPQLEEAEMVV